MYVVDGKDEVVEIDNLPQSSVGAPIPTVVASESSVLLIYYLQETPDDWDGQTVKMISSDSFEPLIIIKFKRCTVHMFGPPNDESFSGHPLASRGLGSYSVYEVVNSSWIRTLEKMNSVHSNHNKARYMEGKKHFIFSFHDSTFECIAREFEIEVTVGTIKNMIPKMIELVT